MIMTDEVVKDEPIATKLEPSEEMNSADGTPKKKPRTSEDFYLFCKYILEHEKYETKKEENNLSDFTNNEDSEETDKPGNSTEELMSDDDSFDLVTCFCQKPFAGRPMIECSRCFTWIHLRCAKIKKSEIPEVFICSNCRSRNNNPTS